MGAGKQSPYSDISSRNIRAFVAVADGLSYTKAADMLGYTEPAVHHQVRALESALGCKLFTNLGRSIELTDVGVRLFPICGEILRGYERLHDSASNRNSRTEISVACTSSLPAILVSEAAILFSLRNPDMTVDMRKCSEEEGTIFAEQGKVEFVCSSDYVLPWGSKLIQRTIHVDRLVIVGSRREMVDDLPETVDIYTDLIIRPKVALFLRELSRMRNVVIHRLTSLEARKQACMMGLGLVCAPVSSFRSELERGLVHRLPGFEAEIRVTASYLDEHLSPAGREFLSAMRTSARFGVKRMDPYRDLRGEAQPAK